jgi:hypothetical protein
VRSAVESGIAGATWRFLLGFVLSAIIQLVLQPFRAIATIIRATK